MAAYLYSHSFYQKSIIHWSTLHTLNQHICWNSAYSSKRRFISKEDKKNSADKNSWRSDDMLVSIFRFLSSAEYNRCYHRYYVLYLSICFLGINSATSATTTLCGPGFFSNNTSNSTPCTPCGFGQYQSLPGQLSCLSCQPGFYADVRGATVCKPCDVGFYTDQTEQSQCTPCSIPSSSTTRSFASDSHEKCVCRTGTYLNAQKTSCMDCGIGLHCPIGADLATFGQEGSIQVRRFFYATTRGGGKFTGRRLLAEDEQQEKIEENRSLVAADDEQIQVFACDALSRDYVADLSVGSSTQKAQSLVYTPCKGGGLEACEAHHIGFACGDCEPNYYRGYMAGNNYGRCEECAGVDSVVFPVFLLFGILFVFVLHHYLAPAVHKVRKSRAKDSILRTNVGMLLTVLQLLAVVTQLTLKWPVSLQENFVQVFSLTTHIRFLRYQCSFFASTDKDSIAKKGAVEQGQYVTVLLAVPLMCAILLLGSPFVKKFICTSRRNALPQIQNTCGILLQGGK